MKKAVIFDLDGTLLYTLEDLADSVNFALKRFNSSSCSLSQVRSFVGDGVQKLMERALASQGIKLSCKEFEDCLRIFKENYKDNIYNKTRPYVGVEEMLQTLKDNGFKIAVVSNKFDSAVKELCNFYFKNSIDIAIGESSSINKKPNPDGVFAVIKELGLNISDCFYIGDSEVDIQTAKNAGMDCLSVDWGYKNREFLVEQGAEQIFSSVPELVKFLLQN